MDIERWGERDEDKEIGYRETENENGWSYVQVM